MTQTAQIADGWLPLYYSPYRQDVYASQLVDAKADFETVALTTVKICDDVDEGLMPIRQMIAFYVGGMGAKGQNYHTKLAARMGLGDTALEIQDLFMSGKREEAVMAVPKDFADEISLVGPAGRIKERLAAWEDSPVTAINIAPRSIPEMQQIAEIFFG